MEALIVWKGMMNLLRIVKWGLPILMILAPPAGDAFDFRLLTSLCV